MRDEVGTVLVTGGSSGLGAAVATAVEEHGGTAIVLDRVPPQNGFAFEPVDLANAREAEAAVKRAADTAGGLDAIVTAAGTDACGDIHEVDPDDWDRCAGTANPFTSHAFLSLLETSGSVGGQSGWSPLPLMVDRGGLSEPET